MSTSESDISALREFYNTTIGGQQLDYEGLREEVPSSFTSLLHPNIGGEIRRGLDIGYGYGQYTVALAQANYKVDAIDIIDANMLNSKLADLALLDRVNVIEQDARQFMPKQVYDLVVSKDVLHYFTQPEVTNLLGRVIKYSGYSAAHYLVIFSDIQRRGPDGNAVKLKGEAAFSRSQLISTIGGLYGDWRINVTTEPYEEPSFDSNVTIPYFSANKNTIICSREL